MICCFRQKHQKRPKVITHLACREFLSSSRAVSDSDLASGELRWSRGGAATQAICAGGVVPYGFLEHQEASI